MLVASFTPAIASALLGRRFSQPIARELFGSMDWRGVSASLLFTTLLALVLGVNVFYGLAFAASIVVADLITAFVQRRLRKVFGILKIQIINAAISGGLAILILFIALPNIEYLLLIYVCFVLLSGLISLVRIKNVGKFRWGFRQKLLVALARINVTPAQLTITATVLGALAIIALAFHQYYLTAFLIFLELVFDSLDGALARFIGRTSVFWGRFDLVKDIIGGLLLIFVGIIIKIISLKIGLLMLALFLFVALSFQFADKIKILH